MFWLGLDDFFLHAAYGGDPTKAPLTPTGPYPMALMANMLLQ
jgi:hypothetical protein